MHDFIVSFRRHKVKVVMSPLTNNFLLYKYILGKSDDLQGFFGFGNFEKIFRGLRILTFGYYGFSRLLTQAQNDNKGFT